MNEINYIIQQASKYSTQTEFLKSIQHNDRYGCITLEDGETRWYPELQNKKVSHFLKDMYKSVKTMEREDNEAVKEIIEEVVEEDNTDTVTSNQVSEEATPIKLIKAALSNAGYEEEPTEDNLIECFKDYVDSGTWSNLNLEEVNNMIIDNELTVNQMCKALIRL